MERADKLARAIKAPRPGHFMARSIPVASGVFIGLGFAGKGKGVYYGGSAMTVWPPASRLFTTLERDGVYD